MRILPCLPVAFVFSCALFGQHSGGARAGGGGYHRGGGYHLGGSGLVGGSGARVVVMPYSYPVPVYGAGYAYPSAYPQYYTDGSYPVDPGPQQPPQPSNVTVIYPPPQQAVPAPDANPEPVSPYEPRDQPAADQALADHYLIALKDHAIYAAVAYWVDGDTLHYFTAGNVHNQASLSLVDRDLTARLNTEAGHEVKLPSAK